MKFFSNLLAVAGVALAVVGTLAAPASQAASAPSTQVSNAPSAQVSKAPSPQAAATSPTDVTNAIQMVTAMSSSLQSSVANLNLLTFPLQGSVIPNGLANITNTVGSFTATLSGPPFADAAAQDVVAVLTTFVRIHQNLLATIIGKHSLAAMFFLTAPIADALRSIESVVDSFAFALIDLIPTQSSSANAQFNSLTGTFNQANAAYA